MKIDSIVKSVYMAGGETPSRYISASSFSVECKIGGILQSLKAGAVLGVDARYEGWEHSDPVIGYHYPVP